ncbi:hypothetical protein SGCOL_007825 [Colletotrichum sp. CLE4]
MMSRELKTLDDISCPAHKHETAAQMRKSFSQAEYFLFVEPWFGHVDAVPVFIHFDKIGTVIYLEETMHGRKMHVEVQRCTEKDIPRVFEIVSLAFANDHEFVDAVFPAHSSPEGRKLGSERMLATFHGDPYSIFLKCINTDTGRIVAAAKWNIYKGGPVPPPPQLDGDYWENEEEKRFAQALFHGFLTPRQQAIEESGAKLVGTLK